MDLPFKQTWKKKTCVRLLYWFLKLQTVSGLKSNMGGVVWHPSLFAYPGQSKNMLIRRHTNCITRRRQHSIKSSLRYLPAHISNADGVHLFRAGINNVQTGYKEKAHTLLPVSWKESLNKKGADFPQLVHFLENIIENERDLLHKGHEEWWRKSRRTLSCCRIGRHFDQSEWLPANSPCVMFKRGMHVCPDYACRRGKAGGPGSLRDSWAFE